PFNGFVNDEHGHKEPFARDYRIAEAILDLDIEAAGIKDSVDEVFQLYAADIGELIGGDDFHVSHQKGWIEPGISDAPFHIAPGHADLVQNVAFCGDYGIVGLASQDIDSAACQIVIFAFSGEQRPRNGISYAPSRFVAVKRAPKRAQQNVAFGSVVVDHAQPAGAPIILRNE